MEMNQNTTYDESLEHGALHPGLDTFTLYDSETMSLFDLLTYMLGSTAGISIDSASLNYIGAESALSYFDALYLGQGVGLTHSGILLTSGDGAPARNNTEDGYSVDHSRGQWVEYDEPQEVEDTYEDEDGNTHTEVWQEEGYWELLDTGDAQLTAIAQKAFPGAGKTYDAAVLEFSFTVTDSSIRSISLDLMFGSEEFPNFIDSSYVDIAAVIVNGQNYAYIDGDESKPLSIVGATTEDGRFIDNYIWNGEWESEPTESPLSIEYNGITPKLTISIPLQEDQSTYQVRIGVADTGDAILDSGLFVSNLQALTTSYEGTLVNVEADDNGAILEAAGPNTATLFVGGKGNDIMKGSKAPDVYDLKNGGANTIKGTLANLDQDTVVGFSEQDTLAIEDNEFTADQLTVTMGSAILDIDSNGDGAIDGSVTLEGDYRKGVFIAENADGNTEIRFKALDLTADQAQWAKAEENEIRVEGTGLTKLLGNTAGKSVTVADGSSVMNVAAGTDITLEGVERNAVQLLRDGTTLLIIDKAGTVLVQLAASTNDDRASTLTLGDDTFLLVASVELESLTLFEVDDGNDPLSAVIFANDGDRLMGSQWEGAAEGEDTAMLAGVPHLDADLLF